MRSLTTHVLDTASGVPAAGMNVQVEKLNGEKWSVLGEGRTNDDGRVPDLLPKETKLELGAYKIRFETEAYFKNKGQECFFPYVEICFEISSLERHHHVPLLISGYGFSTYRGS